MSKEQSSRVPRQARSRAKYQAILQAGLELFRAQGYTETTIDAIVERSGVSVGVFYSYFASKRQLLLALLQHEAEPVGTSVFDLPQQRLTLAECKAVLWRFLRQRNVLHRAYQELVLTDSEFAQQDREIQLHMYGSLTASLERLRLEGRIRADSISATCAWMLLAISARLVEITSALPDHQVETEVHACALLIYHMLVSDEVDAPLPPSDGEAPASPS